MDVPLTKNFKSILLKFCALLNTFLLESNHIVLIMSFKYFDTNPLKPFSSVHQQHLH